MLFTAEACSGTHSRQFYLAFQLTAHIMLSYLRLDVNHVVCKYLSAPRRCTHHVLCFWYDVLPIFRAGFAEVDLDEPVIRRSEICMDDQSASIVRQHIMIIVEIVDDPDQGA